MEMDPLTEKVSETLHRARRKLGVYIPPSEYDDCLQDCILATIIQVRKLADPELAGAACYYACLETLRNWVDDRKKRHNRPADWWAQRCAKSHNTLVDWEFLDSVPANYRAAAYCMACGQSQTQTADTLGTTRQKIAKQVDGLRRNYRAEELVSAMFDRTAETDS